MLCQAGTKLLGIRRMTVDLDQAEDGRDPSQEAEARALGFPRWIGLVAEVGVLGLRGDLIVRHRRAGGTESFLADLLGELIEAVAHE